MRLTPAQKQIYNYLKERGGATYRELNDNLYMRKSDMRIAEMNRAYRETHGEDLIVTKRKKPNGEHIKGLKQPLTKKKQVVEYVGDSVRVEYVDVPV